MSSEGKRRAIFKYCRDRADIVLLQETHSTKVVENIWQNEWGGKIIYSHGTSAARGVCTMFKKGFNCKIKTTKIDENGRICLVEINVEDVDLAICNVYGTNKDDVSHFTLVEKLMLEVCEK